jgi:hypothetical protein
LDDTKKFARLVLDSPHFSAGVKAAWQRVLDEIAKAEAKMDQEAG